MYVERREIFELRPRQAFLILFETIEENSAVTFPNHQTGNFGRVGGDGGGHDPRFPTRNGAGNPDSPQAVIFLTSITDVMMRS